MPKAPQRGTVPPPFQLPKHPTWYTLPQQPITYIYADHRIETDIDVNGVGRVRVKPGYNINVEEIRYDY